MLATFLSALADAFFSLLTFRSMVNCMTLNPTSRVALASCRNAFTMVSEQSTTNQHFILSTLVAASCSYHNSAMEFPLSLSFFCVCVCEQIPRLEINVHLINLFCLVPRWALFGYSEIEEINPFLFNILRLVWKHHFTKGFLFPKEN
jgi:hypothetical protein